MASWGVEIILLQWQRQAAATLCTPGPDEAVEPVVMGLAARMLRGFSDIQRITLENCLGTILFAGAMAASFLIRAKLLKP